MFSIINKIPNCRYTKEEFKEAMLNSQKMLLKKGYTLISDCIFNELGYDSALDMAINDELKLRLNGVFTIYNETKTKDFINAIEKRKKYNYKDILKIDTAKYFVDGSLSMIDPFTKEYCKRHNLPFDYQEPLLWNKKDLLESMIQFQKQKFNIHVHAMGDYAARISIDYMNIAYKFAESKNIRNVLAHCSYIKDIDKSKMSNIIASIQPKWESELSIATPYLTDMLGIKRKKTTYPNKSLLDNNVICAYGSDFPVDMPDPFVGIQTAITRRLTKKSPLYYKYGKYKADMPSECVSLKAAIKAHTINGAYQHHLDDITGSIEVGKSADIILLDRNIEDTPIQDICMINVIETIFKGETVYKKCL